MKKRHLFLNGLAFFICFFLFVGSVFSQTQTKVMFIPAGTWSVPSQIDGQNVTVNSVTFEAWGGGGAGGYCWTSVLITPGGGGGGAAYAKSATLTDVTADDEFTVAIGAGGTAIGNTPSDYTIQHGGTSYVMRNGDYVVKAVGGKSVSGVSNLYGAAGGSASECVGAVKYSGGKGGNADKGLLESGAWCVSGSGGGAGGPGGNGGDAGDSYFNDGGHLGQWTGPAGGGNGSGAGKGGDGRESQIFGGGGWGNAQGNAGGNYGGGGGGAISNGVSWGDANGGQGGSGAVRVTIVYTGQSISAENASANICSGTNIDIPLNITATGFDLADAHISYGGSGTTPAGVTYTAYLLFKTTDNKWHVLGSATNSNSETKAFSLSCTAKTQDNTQSAPFTVTVNVYGQLDGGTIAENQFVCQNQSIQTLTSVQDATGGSGNGSYQWWQIVNVDENDIITNSTEQIQIAGANAATYTPTLNGVRKYWRVYKDQVCGSVNSNELEVATVNPFSFDDDYAAEDTICSNASYTKYLSWDMYTPVGSSSLLNSAFSYLQKSTDKGATWVDITTTTAFNYTVSLAPADFSAGDDIWYRVALKLNDCDSIPHNSICKVHVKKIPDYTGQFPDVNITLWYGACDTSIAALVPPTLDPTPASINRADAYGNRLTPGEYELRWNVIADNCNIPVEYTQNVKVEYPACGTLTDPLPMTDNDGIEYQTIRIGCECWMAENLRTNAPDAVYYDEDPANEQFGKLYTWADAVGCNETPKETKSGATYVQGILPDNWSIPTMEQYNKLLLYFNTEELKSDETGTWLPDHLGTNASGFNLKAGGYYDVVFQRLLGYADFWVVGVTSSNPDKAPAAEFRYDCDGTINCIFVSKTAKLSVRGVRVSPK